jgi:hypothetical protein
VKENVEYEVDEPLCRSEVLQLLEVGPACVIGRDELSISHCSLGKEIERAAKSGNFLFCAFLSRE